MNPTPTPEFWHLLDETRPSTRDPKVHADAIVERLTGSGSDAAIAFARDMDAALSTLYTWDLWGAAYLALGGCSDDAFLYLRAWIIGGGQGDWALAEHEPESLFLRLFEESPDAGPLDMRLSRGEHLVYAAGRAHETLTGRWLEESGPDPAEPRGEPWDEPDLPARFPTLYRLVANSWEQTPSAVNRLDVLQLVADGLDAAATGHHGRAEEILRPLFDDPESWAMIAANPNSRVGVAYVLGVGDLVAGKVDRAGDTFRRVIDDIGEHDELRRGLAQVELARGDLEAAGSLLDPSPQATRFDRILCAKLAWRRADEEEAVRRAREEVKRPISREDHPWDVAGAFLQAGQIFADAGLVDEARTAAKSMKSLIRGAPQDLELVLEWKILQAAVERLRGRPEKALGLLRATHVAGGYTRASRHRELSRTLQAMGRSAEADQERRRAVELLTEAGELWEAANLQA